MKNKLIKKSFKILLEKKSNCCNSEVAMKIIKGFYVDKTLKCCVKCGKFTNKHTYKDEFREDPLVKKIIKLLKNINKKNAKKLF